MELAAAYSMVVPAQIWSQKVMDTTSKLPPNHPARRHRNEVHLHGIVTADPQLKYTASGKAVVSFTVLTKYEESVEYHRCVAWERVAERLTEMFKKDSFIALAGRLQTRSWEQGGQKRYMTEVVAWNVSDGTKEKNAHGIEVGDDDIPF